MWDYLRLWLGGRKGYFTHIHHEGVPVEYSENILERLKVINDYKPSDERALRKALIRRVPDRLLSSFLKAEKDYKKAVAAYERAQRKFYEAPSGSGAEQRARDKYHAADRARSSASAILGAETERISWDEIHARVCHPNCPWTPSKRNIFSRGKSIMALKG